MHTITIQFGDENQAVGWFVAAQALGAIPEDTGLRYADALDWPRGAKRRGELRVSKEDGPARWVVQSESRRAEVERINREGSEALSTLLEPEEADERWCQCGHSDRWHAKGGDGECENDADCPCRTFTSEPTVIR